MDSFDRRGFGCRSVMAVMVGQMEVATAAVLGASAAVATATAAAVAVSASAVVATPSGRSM